VTNALAAINELRAPAADEAPLARGVGEVEEHARVETVGIAVNNPIGSSAPTVGARAQDAAVLAVIALVQLAWIAALGYVALAFFR
jgi:hypothetical protein